jgi:hypothetical protein
MTFLSWIVTQGVYDGPVIQQCASHKHEHAEAALVQVPLREDGEVEVELQPHLMITVRRP